MDNDNFSTEEQKFGIQEIKVEAVKSEDKPYFHHEELCELYIDQGREIENNLLNTGVSKYECEFTGRILIDEKSSTHHTNEYVESTAEQHHEGKMYKCEHPNCGKSFKTKSKLDHHFASHTNFKPFKCEQTGCIKSFRTKWELNSHIKMHNNEKPFKCEHDNCSRSFKRQWELNNHIRTHYDEKPFRCNQIRCTKAFKSEDELNHHIAAHSHEKPFRCEVSGCTKAFKWKNELNCHMKMHTGEKQFKCRHSGCPKAFKTNHELNCHLLRHSGEKLFKCDYVNCDKSFKTKNELNCHLRLHTGEKPFKCKQIGCTKAFTRMASLNYHTRVHAREVSSCSKIDSTFNENVSKPSEDNEYSSEQLGGHHIKEEITIVNDMSDFESKVELKHVRQCSNCKQMFNEVIEYQEHLKCCEKYCFEFVEVDRMKTDDIVGLKIECEN